MDNKIIHWLGQRDMIANIFMMLRDKNEKEVIKQLSEIYNNQFDGKTEPNPHVEYYIKNKL